MFVMLHSKARLMTRYNLTLHNNINVKILMLFVILPRLTSPVILNVIYRNICDVYI